MSRPTHRPPRYVYYPPAAHSATHEVLGMSLANQPMLVISRPLPQQPIPRSRYPRQTHGTPAHPRPPKQLAKRDRRKRYGVVFNTDPLHGMVDAAGGGQDDDDDESTWSMSRSRSRMHSRRHSRPPANARSRNSSPAQEIAARYRASHSGDEPFSASSTTTVGVSYVDGYAYSPRLRTNSGSTDLSSTSGPRLRYRDSRAHALDRAKQEAFFMAVHHGGYANVPCQRPGCRQVLPTINDLASHLVMHDIDPRATDSSITVAGSRYHSFLDMGHSVRGPQRKRRYAHTPAPYTKPLPPLPSRSKFRQYLFKLAHPCIPCGVTEGYDEDDFFY